jgi:hypothetical protein
MEWYLKNQCSCGGDVCVLTCLEREKYTNKKVIVVSHGICLRCNNIMVFPGEEIEKFLSAFKLEEKYQQ